MILVSGATGRVGGATLRHLSARGMPARALVYSRDRAAAPELPGITCVEGAFEDRASLERAMDGVCAALLVSPMHPDQCRWHAAFIDAARHCGVGHVVRVSGYWADADAAEAVVRWHGQSERALEASGVGWAHLRPNAFMQNLLAAAPMIRRSGVLVSPFADAPAAMIDVDDVGRVAATVLTEAGHVGRAYVLTGPAAVTGRDVAAALSRTIGQSVRCEAISLDQARRGMTEAGRPAWLVDAVGAPDARIVAGEAAAVTDGVEALTGDAPRSLKRFLADHLSEFDPSVRGTDTIS